LDDAETRLMMDSMMPGRVAMVVLVGGSTLGVLWEEVDFFWVVDLVEVLLLVFEGAAVA
jgi:hypothetical protein